MIELREINKTFRLKSGNVDAVRDVSLTIDEGSIYGIIGYSGAGKSTLIRCLNLLETPDSGLMNIDGKAVFFENGAAHVGTSACAPLMTEKQKNRLRRGIGMIFQHFNLLDRSTVYENVAYPLRYTGRSGREIRDRVMELLEMVGLSEKANVYPSQLSGGQKQRVAIARALANRPKILLSDEATSALDPEATETVLALLKDLNRKLGLTIVLITHEMAVIKSVCRRVAVMEDGRVAEEGDVYEIFAHPKEAITKRFVASTSALGKVDKLIREGSSLVRLKKGERLARLSFDRESVDDHIISTVSRDFGIDVNIVLANVEVVQDNPMGGMIAILGGQESHIQDAMAFLRERHVTAEVIAHGN